MYHEKTDLFSIIITILVCVSAVSLSAKRVNCSGNDALRGDYECRGTADVICVQIVTPTATVECKGERYYAEPLIVIVGDVDDDVEVPNN